MHGIGEKGLSHCCSLSSVLLLIRTLLRKGLEALLLARF